MARVSPSIRPAGSFLRSPLSKPMRDAHNIAASLRHFVPSEHQSEYKKTKMGEHKWSFDLHGPSGFSHTIQLANNSWAGGFGMQGPV